MVFRRATGSQWGLAPAEQLAREAATLRALGGVAGAPALIGLADDVLVEEYVAGRAFSYLSDLPALGAVVAEVHRRPAPHLPALDAVQELRADALRWLSHARRPELVAPLRALARDLLDWEGARRGHPAWELAHALSPTTTLWEPRTAAILSPDRARELITAYLDAGGLVAAVRDLPVLMDAVVLRALAWCAGVDVLEGSRLAEQVAPFRSPQPVANHLERTRQNARACQHTQEPHHP